MVPYTATKYKNPEDNFTILSILDFVVFGDIKNIVSALFLADARYSFDSSMDISGRMNPSIPAFFASTINFEYPL